MLFSFSTLTFLAVWLFLEIILHLGCVIGVCIEVPSIGLDVILWRPVAVEVVDTAVGEAAACEGCVGCA